MQGFSPPPSPNPKKKNTLAAYGEYGDEHTGIRRLESRREHAWEQRQQPQAPDPSLIRRAPHPSTDAPWMHRPRRRPGLVQDRPPQSPLQPRAPTPQRRLRAPQRSDDTNIMSSAPAQHSSTEWAHTWRAIHSAALDRPGRVVAWRLQHGKLFVEAFGRHIHRGTPASASHLSPHVACQEQLATLSQVMLSCQIFQAVWQWICSHIVSSGSAASTPTTRTPPAGREQTWSTAASRRAGQLVAETLRPGHHSAVDRILQIPHTARSPMSPPRTLHIEHCTLLHRVISAARKQMRCDWQLVGSDIRLRTGVLSHCSEDDSQA